MKIKHYSDTDWHKDHPSGAVVFQYCLEGDPRSRENFMLTLGRQDGDFFMPRHRHNFEQIRLPLNGDMTIGEGLKLKEGQVGYFPEGLPYGPQDDPLGNTPPGRRLQLVLQFGGTSGCGFMSMSQRLAARDDLAKEGEFVGPNYRHPGGKLEWGLNVIWRHVFGERLKYPMPRYPKVVIAEPARFNWIPTPETVGVSSKFLGSFSERAAWIEMVKLAPGSSWTSTHATAVRLLFVVSGAAVIGSESIASYSSIQVEAGETLNMQSTDEVQIFLMGLPPIVIPADSEAEFELVDGAAHDRV